MGGWLICCGVGVGGGSRQLAVAYAHGIAKDRTDMHLYNISESIEEAFRNSSMGNGYALNVGHLFEKMTAF